MLEESSCLILDRFVSGSRCYATCVRSIDWPIFAIPIESIPELKREEQRIKWILLFSIHLT